MAEVLIGVSTVISDGVTINCGALSASRDRVGGAPTALIVNNNIISVPANTITRRFIGDLLNGMAD
jgi:hypothetical protein